MNYHFAFLGSDNFSTKVLDELTHHDLQPTLLITTPDKPKGRGLKITPGPVKIWSKAKDIPCLEPTDLKTILPILDNEKFNFLIVASYGKIIPPSVLDSVQHKILNIHPSLLPKLRGAAPIERGILEGGQNIGVSIMLVDEKMDHGPLLAKQKIDFKNQTAGQLKDQTAILGTRILVQILSDWLNGKLKPTPQIDSQATYAPKISKTEFQIDLKDSPQDNYLKILAALPKPGAFFFIKDKLNNDLRIIVKSAHIEAGQLMIEKVLPAGSKETTWSELKLRLGLINN